MSDQHLVHLPGTRLTPEVVLHQTLEEIARIKAVTIVIQWDDDTFGIDWSRQQINDMCMGAVLLQAKAAKVAAGGEE